MTPQVVWMGGARVGRSGGGEGNEGPGRRGNVGGREGEGAVRNEATKEGDERKQGIGCIWVAVGNVRQKGEGGKVMHAGNRY